MDDPSRKQIFQVVSIDAPAVPRLALNKREAAEALGVSVNFFEAEIAHELRMVRRGRRRLIPVRELERWLEKHADMTHTFLVRVSSCIAGQI